MFLCRGEGCSIVMGTQSVDPDVRTAGSQGDCRTSARPNGGGIDGTRWVWQQQVHLDSKRGLSSSCGD
jgi:hypothetical protein